MTDEIPFDEIHDEPIQPVQPAPPKKPSMVFPVFLGLVLTVMLIIVFGAGRQDGTGSTVSAQLQSQRRAQLIEQAQREDAAAESQELPVHD